MKIIVCGCSFMTIDKRHPGTHFSEILAKNYNADLECFAKMGASNFTIRLQIDEAINQKPDLILIGFTNSDRIEIPIRKYRIDNGIKNISYSEYNKAPNFYNSNDVSCVSQPISNFFNPVHSDEILDEEKLIALKHYSAYLFDSDLKSQLDYFIAQSALDRLEKLGIPFIFTRGGLVGTAFSYENWKNFEVNPDIGNPWLFVEGGELTSGVYHTTFLKQEELSVEWDKLLNFSINKV